MEKSLTVGELKKIIANSPDDLPVYVTVELARIKPGMGDSDWYVPRASYRGASSISNSHIAIEIGESFGW